MVVLGVLVGFMAVAVLATMTCIAVWVASTVRERWIWRDGGEPYIPSRVYIDERYGGADADATRQTGYLGPTWIATYKAARLRRFSRP
ncbi:MAG: hypothetical protein DLM59_19760 [Pseudonocardiales bacterium]|nr:MAG: hypothetical protein DLM59_19760 [Pseudonocardiales bacterium]